jgi:nucleoside-diphosphate-sugar epimerase
MVNVLVTGGNGFIASHILDILVQKGYSVTFTVRTKDKADQVLGRYCGRDASNLSAHIIPDFAAPGAFDKCIEAGGPYDAVVHVASPFKYSVTDINKELFGPSITGTRSLLTAIQNGAPTVKTVIFTSSFAAILDSYRPNNIPEHTYTTSDWNPLTREDAFRNVLNGYRASKLFAERAALEFIADHKPSFSFVSICPTLAFGPLIQPVESAAAINTSSQRIYNFINGSCKSEMPDTGVSFYLWIDVRDLALAHVRAMELQLELRAPANKRYLLTAGYFTNKDICEIIGAKFPEYLAMLPPCHGEAGGFPPGGVYKFDNTEATSELRLEYRKLEESVVDTIQSLKQRGYA